MNNVYRHVLECIYKPDISAEIQIDFQCKIEAKILKRYLKSLLETESESQTRTPTRTQLSHQRQSKQFVTIGIQSHNWFSLQNEFFGKHKKKKQ